MSTTIDSLDIQIRSSAGTAAVNIDKLADSLAKLKANGKISTVANNLKKLKESLDGLKSVNSGIQALEKFGRVFSKMSTFTANVSGFSKAMNSLKKLPSLAGELKSVDFSGFSAQMQALDSGMSSLSGIANPKGLTSSLNALKKIPEITSALNPQIIDEFGDKIEKLAAKLAPLATQIDKVGNGFAKLPSQVSKTVTATNRMEQATRKATEANKKHDKSLNTKSINLMATIQNLQEYAQAIHFVADGVGNVLDDAMQWDSIQFRFGRAFGEDAEEVLEHAQKINDALDINLQQFMQYSSMYGSLLSGFGMAQEQVTTISVGLTELSYDIWAAYNDRYKSLEDASEAVRSAITGEIEPIRNAGIALTEASMQEFADNYNAAESAARDTVTAFEEIQGKTSEIATQAKETKSAVTDMLSNGIGNGALQATADVLGLDVSVEKLTESQKSELRYATMVNAAMNQGIVGTYAAEMNTAEGVMRSFSQQLRTLAQAFGSLFIPAIMKVMPWITAFVSILTDAIRAIALVFGIELQKIDWGSSSAGVGGLADSANNAADALGDAGKEAKKLKDYTMGFDELNVIDPDKGSSSGSGSGGGGVGSGGSLGLDLDTLWDESVFAKAQDKAKEIKKEILGFIEEFKVPLATLGTALGALGLTKLLSHMSEALGFDDKFAGVLNNVKRIAGTAIIITVQFMLQSMAFESFIDGEGLLKYIEGLLIGGISAYILKKQWGPGGLVISLGITALASFKAVWDNGGITNAESATVALTGLASAAGALMIAWKKMVPIITDSNLVRALAGVAKGSEAAGSALTFMFPTLTKIGSGFATAAKAVGTFLGGISAPVWGGIALAVAAVASAIYFLTQNWNEVKKAAKNFFDINIVPKLEEMKESWGKIKEALSPLAPLFQKIKEVLKPVVKTVKEFVSNIDFDGFLSSVGKVIEWIGGNVFYVLTMNIAGLISSVTNVIAGFVRYISGIVQIVSGIVQAVVKLFSGDLQGALESTKLIGKGIKDVFGGLYDMTIGSVVEFVKGIIEWFTSLWDELVGHSIVPDTIDSIVDWFLSLPKKILSKLKQEFIDPVINKFLEMKNGITGKIEEIKKMFSTKWGEVKTWFSTNVAPKLTLEYWKGKFNAMKEGITVKIGEIKSMFSTKWGEVKTWFSTSVSPKLTKKYWTDKWDGMKQGISTKVGEVKDAIVSKWREITTWFADNVSPKLTKDYWLGKFANIKEGFVTTIKGMINTAIGHMNTFIGWLNSKMKFSWNAFEVAGKELVPGGSIQLFTIPKIPTLATGGIVNEGQMFIAREAGPELVGNINGRTAVANNDQIVAAVSQGVYSAVMAAMGNNSNNSGEQHINVYLDGKQITASVEKRQAERGRTLMGNQLGYGY